MPSARPFGRSRADFEPLNDPEQKLLESCRLGNEFVLSDTRPKAGETTAINTIRASFLRFLILGGDDAHPVHEHGVRVCGAWITGALDLNGVASTSEVWARFCWFDQAPDLTDGHIKGNLLLSGSRVPGLKAHRLTCDASLFFRDKFIADGEMGLSGAKIGGDLTCNGATFGQPLGEKNRLGDALSADNITIKGNAFLTNGFTANGAARLLGATIGGTLECDGATFNGPLDEKNRHGNALSADRTTVKGGAFFRNGFTANGTVRLLRATIGGVLTCDGATFNGPLDENNRYGIALHADGIDVKADLFLREGFTANGTVRLLGATIGGNLEWIRANLNAGPEYSLNMERSTVAGALIFRELTKPAVNVNLALAHVGVLADDSADWGEGLDLDGFTYDRLGGGAAKDAKTRRAWLDKQAPEYSGRDGKGEKFRPQPWLQLRKVLRDSGHTEDARKLGIALENRRRHCGQITGAGRALHWIYGAFTGYGYRPIRLLYWSFGIWLACAALYGAAGARGLFAPADTTVFATPDCVKTAIACPAAAPPPANWVASPPFSGHYPVFNPWIYSLNVFLPVVALGQEAAWAPVAQPAAAGWGVFLPRLTDPGFWVQFAIWAETLFGWVAGLLLVAVVSGLARKQDDS